MISIDGLARLTVVKLVGGCTIAANTVARTDVTRRMLNRPIASGRPMLCRIVLVARHN